MKTFCPNCEKETDCNFDAELYSCNERGEDFSSYEKYWKKQACAAVKHMLEMTSFLRHIMTLGLLRGSPRLTTRALEILDGFEASGIEDSVTQDVEKSELADQVMDIIHAAISGDCQRYLNYDLQGNRYCKWGVVEKDIRAVLINTKTSLSVENDDLGKKGRRMMEGDPRVDRLMWPIMLAIKRHVKNSDAATEIYNRAYEAIMNSMDVIDLSARVTAKQIAENAKNLQRAEAAENELAQLKNILIAWHDEPDGGYNQPSFYALCAKAAELSAQKGGEK